MKHRTPANNNAGDTFTASLNNMMRDDRATCAHAAQALAIFAARAEKRFRLTLLMIALSNLALFVALYMSRA